MSLFANALACIGSLVIATHVRGTVSFVTNTNYSGVGSLREAVVCANSNAGPDAIVFTNLTGTIMFLPLHRTRQTWS